MCLGSTDVRRAACALALALVTVGLLHAQETSPPTPPGGMSLYSMPTAQGEKLITLDATGADIRDALRAISEESGVNIIAGPEVEGQISLRIVDAPWEEALEAVLRAYGYSYERRGNIIRVTTTDKLDTEELETEIILLSYATAEEIRDSLTDMLSSRGSIKTEPRANALIITDIKSRLDVVMGAIQRLDSRTPMVVIDARMLEINLDREKTLGIGWNFAVSAQGGARPIIFPFENDHVGGDYYPLVDSSRQSEAETGSDGSSSGGGNDVFVEGTPFPYATEDLFTFGTLSFTQLQAQLRLAESEGDTNLISNPKIATLDNQTAYIQVGDVVPIPIYERNEQTGGIDVTGYDEQDIGIMLEVTPHVNQDGFVTLDVKPEVSEITGYTGPNNERPITSTRQAKTRVMVKSGYTLAIGGLISDRDSKHDAGIPFLSKIPVLRWLFMQSTTQHRKTDLLIFITPLVSPLEPEMTATEALRWEQIGLQLGESERLTEGGAAGHWVKQGRSLEKLDDLDEAAAAYQRALELDPRNREAERGLARVRRADAAVDTHKPGMAAVAWYVEQGRSLYSRGELEQAREQFEKALALDPDNDTARRYLARISAARGQ